MSENQTSTRSWSTLTVKSVDEEQRRITGIATTPSTDRVGDVVEPKGASFSLPFPLLSQHDHESPIGHVVKAEVTDEGIAIEADIAKGTDLWYIERAWKQIKAGLVRGLSIGFRPLKAEPIKGHALRYLKYEIFELSVVTIQANADCSIATIKSADQGRHSVLVGATKDAVSRIPTAEEDSAQASPGQALVDRAIKTLSRTTS